MHPFIFLFSPVIQALGYTLLYSFGQAFIIFICLRVLLKLIQNVSASVKYCLSYFSYLVIATWFGITFIQQFSMAKNQEVFEKITGNDFSLQSTFSQNNTASSSVFSLSFLNEYLPWIVGLYLLGLFWYSLQLSIHFFQSNRLKKTGLSDLDTDWLEHINNLCEKMNIARPLKTYFSRHVNTPAMIGFLKPVILLPLATMNQLTPQQFEAILLHELAHIKRNDYLLNLIQSVLDIFLFFNPFSWWISKYIREEREKCCDEMVLKLSDPYHYARALISLEEPLRNQPLIMTAISKHPHLFNRIKNIMEMKKNPLNLRQKLITLLVIIIAISSVAWLSPQQKITSQSKNIKIIATNKLQGNYVPQGLPFLSLSDKNDSVPHKIAPFPPLPPIPPVAMLNNKNVPLPPTSPLPPLLPNRGMIPVPPAAPLPPPMPVPPLPPSNINDSFPTPEGFFKSKGWKQQQEAIKKSADEMRKFFQSDTWKKQQNLIQQNATAMKKYFNSTEWKRQQKEIRHATDSLTKYFKSEAWQKQQDNIQKIIAQTQKYFQSNDWQKQMENLKNAMNDSQEKKK